MNFAKILRKPILKSICEWLLLTSELNFSSQYLIRIFYKEKHGVKSVQTRSFFWSVFSCIWTEYGIEKTFILGHFSRSGMVWNFFEKNRNVSKNVMNVTKRLPGIFPRKMLELNSLMTNIPIL